MTGSLFGASTVYPVSMSIDLNPAQESTRADLEELLQEIEEAERQFAAGLGVPHEVAREQILADLAP